MGWDIADAVNRSGQYHMEAIGKDRDGEKYPYLPTDITDHQWAARTSKSELRPKL